MPPLRSERAADLALRNAGVPSCRPDGSPTMAILISIGHGAPKYMGRPRSFITPRISHSCWGDVVTTAMFARVGCVDNGLQPSRGQKGAAAA